MAINNRSRSSRRGMPSDKNTASYQRVQQAATELDKAIQAMDRSAREASLLHLFTIVFNTLLIVMLGLLIFAVVYLIRRWSLDLVLNWAWGLCIILLVVVPYHSFKLRVGGLCNGCIYCICLATMTSPPIPLTVAIPVIEILTLIVGGCALCRVFRN